MIKLRPWRWGGHPGLPREAQLNHKIPYRRETGDLEGNVMTEAKEEKET